MLYNLLLFSLLREEPSDFFTFEKGPNDRAEPESYPFWIVCFSGVAAVVFALLHAALWRPFSMIFGAIVSSRILSL